MIAIYIIIGIIALILYEKFIKPIIIVHKLKLNSLTLVSGSVKTGKSTLAIYLATSKYRTNVFLWKIGNLFRRLFKKKLKEKPLFYSNIPINVKGGYIPITKKMLLREEKINEKSVMYIGEFSLVADSMTYKDDLTNEDTTLFFKLFGHQFNGSIFVDTQNVSDCHYCIKRNINKYIYIDKGYKSLLFYNVYIRELAYNYENNNINNNMNNKGLLEEQELKIKIPKSIWKIFDYRCYSVLTDNLKATEKIKENVENLKQNKIVSFRTWKNKSLIEITEEEKENLKALERLEENIKIFENKGNSKK